MKRLPVRELFALMVIAELALSGCTRQTQGDLGELGHDAKRDLQKAGRNVGDAVQDAAD